MMSRTLVRVGIVFAVAIAALLRLVSASSLPPAEFVFVNGTEPRTLDPTLMTGEPEGRIGEALFEGLTRRDAPTLRPVPGVAERWTISPDGLVYTFVLRADARWSDGTFVTAHDFAASWRRLAEPATGSEYAYLVHLVRGGEALHAHGAAADALDGPIRDAFVAWRATRDAAAVNASDWQRFMAEHGVVSALTGTSDPTLRDALGQRVGTISASRLDEIAAAFAREATARRASYREADAHFGRDLGVVAEDAHTLRVELVAATPYFLELTAFYPFAPTPPALVASRPNDWYLPETIVSNGAFVLERWAVNDRIRLRRSPSYWDRANVHLETIDALPIENATTALNLYLAGAVDWLPSNYPQDLAARLATRPDFYRGPGLAVYYYRFNVTRPPFDDPRIREAVSIAIDRAAICDHVLGLGQIPATTFVPPGIPGYVPPDSRLGFDPERARRLLGEAGHPGGEGIREIGILYNTVEMHRKIAEVVADQLRTHLGLHVTAYNQEWQAYQASTQALDYDMARAAWVGDYLDPNTFLDLWQTRGGNNQTGWGDATYDRLVRAAGDPERAAREDRAFLESVGDAGADAFSETSALPAALRTLDAARTAEQRAAAAASLRLALLREAESILVQRGFPVAPIYFYVVSGLVAPHVRGFYPELVFEDGTRAPNLQHVHPLRAISVERSDLHTARDAK